LALLLFWPVLGLAQQGITLDVVVTEKSGAPVLDLQQKDFTLLDNKQPQPILSFRGPSANQDPPTEVIVLLDEVNTAYHDVATETIQAEKFLNQYHGKLPVPTSLAFFTDKGVTGAANSQGPTQSAETLIAELHANRTPLRFIGRSEGVYGAGDRVDLSLRTLEQLTAYEAQRPGRKLLIWISPGWPLLSGPRQDLSEKNEQSIFSTIVGISASLRKAGVTLYSIDPLGTADGLRTFYWQQFSKGVKKPSQVQIGNLALQVLADQSGGLVLNSSNDVAGELARCVSDANNYYQLTFNAQPGDGPDDYHSIEVKVDRPKVTVRTRTGYYAQPTKP